MKPPEEVKRKLVQEWVGKAEQDFKAAAALLSMEQPLLYPACFHAQQAAEKYIKAYLTLHQVEFPKTHDIGELLDLVGEVDKTLARSLDGAVFLNPYGVETRYPGDMPEPTLGEAREALNIVRSVREKILPNLG